MKIEKSIRFYPNPEGNRIDFSDFSPWGRINKSEKLVLLPIICRSRYNYKYLLSFPNNIRIRQRI